MDTIRNDSIIKLALDTIDLEILRWALDEAMSKTPLTGGNTTSSPATCWTEQHDGGAAMNRSRITDDMFARIPALLLEGMTKAEIAAIYGVTPGTLVVRCSQRGISLRRGGTLPKRTKLPKRANLTLPTNRCHSATAC